MSDNHDQQTELPLGTAGQKLKEAREGAGLGTADVAARTRIPERHIIALERGDYGALAARTYAVGFSRLFARAVGLDEAQIAEMTRAELASAAEAEAYVASPSYEPADPSRVSDRRLAWFAALGAFVVVIAGYAFWRQFQVPAMELPSLVAENQAPAAPAASPAPAQPSGGPVVFTATAEGVWVKFYDLQGVQLFQKELALGETYTVPAEAEGPQLWTARPDALAITVGGKPVPPLADRQVTMKDVPVSAIALLGRAAPAADPAITPAVSQGSPQAAMARPVAAPLVRRVSAAQAAPRQSPEMPPPASELPAPVAESTVSE